MDEPILLRYRWTVDECLKAYDAYSRSSFRRFYRGLLYAVATIALVGNGLAYVFSNTKDSAFLYICVFLVLGMASTPLGKWHFRRQFVKRPDNNLDIEWSVTSEQLSISTEHANTDMKWNMLMKVIEAPGGFLLFQLPKLFHWLPKTAFQNQADVERFRGWAKKNTMKYKYVK